MKKEDLEKMLEALNNVKKVAYHYLENTPETNKVLFEMWDDISKNLSRMQSILDRVYEIPDPNPVYIAKDAIAGFISSLVTSDASQRYEMLSGVFSAFHEITESELKSLDGEIGLLKDRFDSLLNCRDRVVDLFSPKKCSDAVPGPPPVRRY